MTRERTNQAGTPRRRRRPSPRQAASAWTSMRQRFGTLRAAILALGGLAGTVGAILSIVYLLWPAVRPDPEQSAKIEALSRHEVSITQEQVCSEFRQAMTEEQRAKCDAATPAMKARKGDLYEARIQAVGFNGDTLSIIWTLVPSTQGTDSSVVDSAFVDQVGWPHAGFSPDRDKQTEVLSVWVPYPDVPGTYRVHFNVTESGRSRDTADSDAFDVS